MTTTTSSLSGRVIGRALTHAFRLARGDRGLHDESTLDDLAHHVTRMRPRIESLAARGRVPRDTRIEVDRHAPVPGEWVRPVDSPDDGPVVLHLHGGAYTLCSPTTHRGTRTLARAARGSAWVPDYRLAPEHDFPAPLDDADLTGLPPMLVHVGVDELIRDDGLRPVERAREHGVTASVGTFAGMWHVFAALPLPESRRSLREIGGFIRRHTARPEEVAWTPR